MLPTVATHDAPGTLEQDRRVARLLALDEILFDPSWWRALDTNNQLIPGLFFTSPTDGLRLTRHDRAAAFMGRLRAGVVAVDVDVDGHEGYAITDIVCRWLDERARPYLIRESGGGDGRAHIITIPAGHTAALAAHCRDVCTSFNLPPARLDVRHGPRALRALSSPHRRTGLIPRLLGDDTHIAHFREALTRDVPPLPRPGASRTRRRPQTTPAPDSRGSGRRVRRGRATVAHDARDGYTGPHLPIPPQWRDYLRTGATPPQAHERGYSHDATAIEAVATGHLLRAGYTAAQAWLVIQQSSPLAMTRARADEGRWVGVWNRELDDSTLYLASQDLARAAVPADVAARILSTRSQDLARIVAARHAPTSTSRRPWHQLWQRLLDVAARAPRATSHEPRAHEPTPVCSAVHHHRVWLLTDGLWRLPALRRPTRYLVADWVLQRAHRQGTLRVPCPDRDLHIDLGLDRKTVRAALADLEHLGFTLHRVYHPQGAAAGGADSHEIEVPARDVVLSPTCSSHNPPPPGCLPAPLHLLHAGLTLAPHPPETPAKAALLLPTPSTEPTAWQTRTARTRLLELGGYGWARLDEDGHWQPSRPPDQAVTPGRAERAAKMEAERAAHARACRGRAWRAGQRAALAAARIRTAAWLEQMPAAERARRRAAMSQRFARLPAAAQSALIARWVRRDELLGRPRPAERYQTWLARSRARPGWQDHCAQRQHEYQQLPQPEQVSRAIEWARRRQLYGTVSPPDTLHVADPTSRDERYLRRERTRRGPALWTPRATSA